jgi:amino acid adenylation domain-containing protein
LNEIVRRHEALRTSFPIIDGQPMQVIVPVLTLVLPVVDLQGLPEAERQVEALRLVDQDIRRPFDLAQDPLFRVTLVRLTGVEHLLLLNMHHIITDEWSLGVLFWELGELYEAYSGGKESPLPELPIQYADYAVWQHERLRGEVFEEQLAYWKDRLADPPPPLTLPTDRPRSPVQTFRGAMESIRVSDSLTEKLKELSQQEGATLFMTLLAAFEVLLYRYTGQTDIVVGTPVANRNRSELEALIGFFVNTLVLRVNWNSPHAPSGKPSFREVLGQVREVALGAFAHQDVPFERLVEKLQPERDLSRSPLFQVMFVLQNTPTETLELPGLAMTPLEVDGGTAQFDLTLSVTETDKGLTGSLEYSTDLFESATIERMIGHFHNLLEGIISNPEQYICDLPLLTEAEQRQLLKWNDTRKAYPTDKCIHEMFETQAKRAPDTVAMVFENEHLTYREMDRRANQLARHLQELGVRAETSVGIYVERSFDTVMGILGILKAGGAYVPIDPVYPMERVAYMLADTQSPVLLTQERLAGQLSGYDGQVICLDTDRERISREREDPPTVKVTGDNLAYIIYTSGSTGKPKGTPVTHYNVTRLFEATGDWFHFNECDVWTLFHTCAFDFSVWELWGALLYGGRLVVIPFLMSRSPEAFYNLLHRERVTVLNQTPSAFRQLIWAEESLGIKALALRLVIFGGEALEINSLRPWYEHHGDEFPQLVNMYGITETTVHVTYRPLTMADVNTLSGSVIGRPIPDLQTYVLDDRLQPVPIGVSGEILVGGAGLSRGYLNHPGLTAERFIPDPFGNEPGARLYRSGDLGRYLPNGDIEYLGRIDHQVKVRGFRIEMGEIEAALAQHPTVRETVALVREDVSGNKRLVAYVVGKDGHKVAAGDLRRFLRDKLPEYMVPAVFVTLGEMPLTPNGKVDRRALPAPDGERPELGMAFVAPRTPVEKMLASIWAEVLELDQVGIHEDFFELGGHSLLAIRVISRIRETFHTELPLRDFFERYTVADLAELVVTRQIEQAEHDALERVLAAVSILSDEEAKQQLLAEDQSV